MTGATPVEPTRRLFFALWPEGELRRQLPALAAHLVGRDGRPQRADQLHVTLEFLGQVPESRLGEVRAVGESAARATAPLEFTLDRLEYWRHPRVLCLVASELPEPLAALVARLRSGLEERGFEIDARPYRAHLTLARKVQYAPPPAAFEPLSWAAHACSLVQSTTGADGSRYEDVANWSLGG